VHEKKLVNVSQPNVVHMYMPHLIVNACECILVMVRAFSFSMMLSNFIVTSSLYGYQHSFGQGTGSAFLSGVSCTGTESTLLICGISTFGQYCSGDAGVVCPCMFHVIILQ